jgi:hypothetical protein
LLAWPALVIIDVKATAESLNVLTWDYGTILIRAIKSIIIAQTLVAVLGVYNFRGSTPSCDMTLFLK